MKWRLVRAVLLASGGFEWDKDLVASFLPALDHRAGQPPEHGGRRPSHGDGPGAALGSMNEASSSPIIQVPGEHYDGHAHLRIVVSQRLYPRSVMVDRSGGASPTRQELHDVGAT